MSFVSVSNKIVKVTLSLFHPFNAILAFKSYSKIRFCLTHWKTLSIATRAASDVNIFMMCAVVPEPLVPVAH